MRRLLATLALLAVAALTAQSAGAQDGYTGGWTDPAPTKSRDAKPLAYLEAVQLLTGEVSHPNGIQRVSAVLVVDPNESPASGCDADMDPNIEVEQNGDTAIFRVDATFPCNLIYELRATAQANADDGITGGAPPPYSMPLFVAVAIPPAPVSSVDAILEIDDDDDVTVTLEWPAGQEADLLGYVVNRVTDDDTETLGQVDAVEHPTFVDADPPVGAASRYEVIAVREGPDEDVEQVAAAPASVTVDVPEPDAEEDADGDGTGGGGETVDPQLAGEATPSDGRDGRAPGSLSSVRVSGAPTPTTPTTLDTGYSETIDYGEVGEAAAAPPGDNAVVAIYDEGTSGSPWSDEETMTFVAGGLAVLSGAGSILTVTRRAARAAY